MAGYLLLHFTAVLFYAFPGRSTSSRSYILSYVYIYPWFHQSWSLFVPPPKQNFRLYVRYAEEAQQNDWKDLFYEINGRHQANRLSGESVLLAFSNALRYYAASAKEKNEIFNDKNADLNFAVLHKVTESYLKQTEKTSINNLELIVVIEDQKEIHAHYYNPSAH